MSDNDKKIKGTMLIDQVRLIRKYRDLDWSPYLGPAEWEAISERILPTEWYPLDLYEKCGWATFKVLARGDVEVVRQRGRERGKELFETTYKSLTTIRDPNRALERFVSGYSMLFNFATLRFERVSDLNARIHRDNARAHETILPYCHTLMGTLEALISATGGKNVRMEFLAKQWEGDRSTIFDARWEM
jgi:uncharacterized protein (TIGR02265 family)